MYGVRAGRGFLIGCAGVISAAHGDPRAGVAGGADNICYETVIEGPAIQNDLIHIAVSRIEIHVTFFFIRINRNADSCFPYISRLRGGERPCLGGCEIIRIILFRFTFAVVDDVPSNRFSLEQHGWIFGSGIIFFQFSANFQKLRASELRFISDGVEIDTDGKFAVCSRNIRPVAGDVHFRIRAVRLSCRMCHKTVIVQEVIIDRKLENIGSQIGDLISGGIDERYAENDRFPEIKRRKLREDPDRRIRCFWRDERRNVRIDMEKNFSESHLRTFRFL